MSSNFFVDAIGSFILRGTNPIYVKDYSMAMKLFNLQDENYKFYPVVKIHHATESTCTSCEG